MNHHNGQREWLWDYPISNRGNSDRESISAFVLQCLGQRQRSLLRPHQPTERDEELPEKNSPFHQQSGLQLRRPPKSLDRLRKTARS